VYTKIYDNAVVSFPISFQIILHRISVVVARLFVILIMFLFQCKIVDKLLTFN
jgi:hypothetical protein